MSTRIPFDLSKFKKISSNDTHTTLQHEDGHQLSVAHKPLSKQLLTQLLALPMSNAEKADAGMAKGGKVMRQANPKLQESKKSPSAPPEEEIIAEKGKEDAANRRRMDMGAQQAEYSPEVSRTMQGAVDMTPKGMHPTMEAHGGPVKPTRKGVISAERKENTLEGAAPLTRTSMDVKHLPGYAQGGTPAQEEHQAVNASKKWTSGGNTAGMMADGGNVAEEPLQIESTEPEANPLQVEALPQDVPSAAPPSTDTAQAGVMQQQNGGQGAQLPPGDQAQLPTLQDSGHINEQRGTFPGALEAGEQGIELQRKAQTAVAQGQQQAVQEAIDPMQAAQEHFTKATNDLAQQRQIFNDYIQNNPVQADHYLKSMTTGGKIMTGIGLILGGIGGGLTHQANPALQFLQSQIDRDIDAQKAQISSRQNLLAHNTEQYGNLRDGMTATRLQLTDILAHKLQSEALKQGGPQAQANALLATQQLYQGVAPFMARLQVANALHSAASDNPQTVQHLLNAADQFAPEVAKSFRERYIPGVGEASLPVPEKQRDEMRARNNFNQQMGQLIQFSKQNSGALDPRVRAQGEALAAQVQDAYRQMNGLGVFREGEQGFVNSFIGQQPAQFFASFRSQPGYQAAARINSQHLSNLYKSFGVNVPTISKTPGF